MSLEDRIFQQRHDKLSEIEQLGYERYPRKYAFTHTVPQIHDTHGSANTETLEAQRPQVRVSGRLMTKRRQGKAGFAHLKQGGLQLQIYIRRDEVSEKAFELYKKLDAGDIVGVSGYLFRTRTNELTLRAADLEFLSKSILPLPEKFHGLQDAEIRYRRRYLDLFTNDFVRETFVARDKIIQAMRGAFTRRGYIEVETPMMQPVYGGALARPFVTHHNALDMDLYLRVAPELYLKRLIVGGLDRVYEINRNFRNEGLSKQHNPEFTMLEFYQAYSDYGDLMEFSKELLAETAQAVLDGAAVAQFGEHKIDFANLNCLTLAETVVEYWPDSTTRPSVNDLGDIGKLRELAAVHNAKAESELDFSGSISPGKALLELFEAACEPRVIQPTIVRDYPVEASPLSKRKPDNPDWVERFEIFCGGMEIANGYSELNDPQEQRARFEEQVALRESGDGEAHGMDEDYLRALCYGMPPVAGEGIGIDRLTMLLTNSSTIRDVVLFPLLRPEKEIGTAERLRKAQSPA